MNDYTGLLLLRRILIYLENNPQKPVKITFVLPKPRALTTSTFHSEDAGSNATFSCITFDHSLSLGHF